ncbi:Flavin-dependent oxidoreductase, luciferase family (includes alkanesulfonate monooxygenase SsuD and methylene tetrahydromethanopterin reductase) [Streptomyces sp. yr375]|uniref:LLM class flavin-dependent oxidoreductase n=1 Tax=Streptomyces sp. yr375 TaxID=1761906 RepID=UPI0008CD41C5|nr:LLM class flavin-dependent oxidoreductase [Streptomyces sp. yr375]SES35842.1 Flavin-dependent oxidoreductase, luciferase family (includes alkanesulfonate monooxygenase SsuD and methylene tetrahydromethanopterin reductase) [Streptomyces sp. yr375]
MKLDMFSEIQDPRPWSPDHEHTRITEALEQARLADELGYGCWWQVEHHGAEEHSLSSAPELFLAALSQQTRRIRLGHAAVLAPTAINHPIRIAERAAMLDHLSNGRVEMGLTRSTAPEWRLFGIDPAGVRDQVADTFRQVPRMWAGDTTVTGGVPVLPAPYQRPHPPLWQAASTPASFEEAGRRGVGVLGTTLWEPLDRVRRLVELYRTAAADCREPVGAFVNDQVAFFTFVHCAETDEQAMRDGAAAAAAWYTARALVFFEAAEAFVENMAREQALVDAPDGGGLAGAFLRAESAAYGGPNRAQLAIGRILQGETVPDDELFEALSEQDSLIVGSPETCRKKLRAYADLGIDRLMCFQQVGALPHESVLRSMRLIGDLIPEFDSEPAVTPAVTPLG